MLGCLLMFALLNLAFSFEKSCSTCKFFISKKNPDLGLCSIFQDRIYNNNTNRGALIHNFAIHCRNNENLCGESGFLHETNVVDKKYKYIKYLHCEELISNKSTTELTEIDIELKKVCKIMIRHNTKRIYKTKHLLNLFKNKNKK
jgi:hypothetical protein